MADIDIIEKGGVVMVILIGLSIYALGVILYKIQQFVTSGVFNARFIDKAMGPVKRGELTEALRILGPIKSPVARIMRVAIECVRNRDISMKSRESEISRVGSQELRYLESHMRGLEMVATTSPLLGLLGTVIGMVAAFSRLGEAGTRVDPSLLANGIWEALLTTVGGLAVAIPAVAAYYVIDSVIEKVRATMKDTTVQILALEDIFLRNEEEQRRVQREKELEVERNKLSAIEQQRRELEQREEELKRMVEEQEKAVSAMRSSPQGASTLRLLNPTYSRF